MIVSRWMEICKDKYRLSSPLVSDLQKRIVEDPFKDCETSDV
jgi:hypothetical protein